MFLDESEENSCSPFFRMEIEKFRGSFGLRLIDIIVELRVGKVDDEGNDIHPLSHQLLNRIVNLIMGSFP